MLHEPDSESRGVEGWTCIVRWLSELAICPMGESEASVCGMLPLTSERLDPRMRAASRLVVVVEWPRCAHVQSELSALNNFV